MRDKRWVLLEDAKGPLLAALADEGVGEIRYVAAFPEPDGVSVWLCTSTDEQREALGSRPDPSSDSQLFEEPWREVAAAAPANARVKAVLLECGLTEAGLAPFGVVVQSQETVDRNFEASWFYAMR